MRSQALDNFNEELIKLAIKKLDKDALATTMAKKLKTCVIKGFNAAVEDGEVSMADCVAYMLQAGNSPAADALEKVMAEITKKMVLSVNNK